MYFKSFVGAPDKFIMSVIFSFFIIGKRSFLRGCCLIVFCWVLFFIQCEYGYRLNVDKTNTSTL